MDNRFQGEEDVGFQNELTPEQIREILAIKQKNPMQMRYDQDVQSALSQMPMYNEQDDIINRLNPQNLYDKQVEDALSKMSMRSPNDILGKLNRNPANMGESADLKQMQGIPSRPMPSVTPSPSPMPSPQENISPEDMEMLNQILMNQNQTQMPSPTPSPFRNIRGTIDRSR